MHKLWWVGSAKLSPEAQYHYDNFILLNQVHGVTLQDITGGEIYKEDLVYLILNHRFMTEAQSKWSNSETGKTTVVR